MTIGSLFRAKRPRVVVIENVPRLIRRGLDTVLSGLIACGYTVEGTRLRAGDVGAPHRRERLFLVAYTDSGSVQRLGESGVLAGSERSGIGVQSPDLPSAGNCCEVADADSGRLEGQRISESAGEQGTRGNEPHGRDGASATSGGHVERGLGRDAHGLSAGLDAQRWPAGRGEPQHEWEPPRTVRIGTDYEDEWRRWRLKSYGNAVLPQCAEIVGWRVRQILERAA